MPVLSSRTTAGHCLLPAWAGRPARKERSTARLSSSRPRTPRSWPLGAPEGSTPKPQPPKLAEAGGLGPPDTTFEPSEAYNLSAEGEDVYRCFVIPTSYAEDRYVSAIEVKP